MTLNKKQVSLAMVKYYYIFNNKLESQ